MSVRIKRYSVREALGTVPVVVAIAERTFSPVSTSEHWRKGFLGGSGSGSLVRVETVGKAHFLTGFWLDTSAPRHAGFSIGCPRGSHPGRSEWSEREPRKEASLLKPNLRCDIPWLLPHSVGHTDQPWDNVGEEYTRVGVHGWGAFGTGYYTSLPLPCFIFSYPLWPANITYFVFPQSPHNRM